MGSDGEEEAGKWLDCRLELSWAMDSSVDLTVVAMIKEIDETS